MPTHRRCTFAVARRVTLVLRSSALRFAPAEDDVGKVQCVCPTASSAFSMFSLGAVVAYAGSRLPPVPGQQVGPNVFPFVIGIGLGLCGLMIAFGIGRSFEEEAEVDLAAHSDRPSDEPDPRGARAPL